VKTSRTIHLLFPPFIDFTQPYVSLPCLTSFLRESGVEVTQWDLNIDFLNSCLEAPALEDLLGRARQAFHLLDGTSSLAAVETARYAALSRVVPFLDILPERIREARATFREMEKFTVPAMYWEARQTMELFFDVLSAVYFPSRITSDYFLMRYSHNSSAGIVKASEDSNENFFHRYFAERVVPKILEEQPSIVGISIMFESQIHAGFTLARLVRERLPETTIVVGGGIVSRIWKGLRANLDLFPYVDAIGIYEGEKTLLGLAEAGTDRGKWGNIPNLVYRDSKGVVRINAFSAIEDLSILPPPDFDGLPLNQYLSPVLIPWLPVARGCYWNRCAFCAYGLNDLVCARYRAKPAERVADEISALKGKYGSRYFAFSVDCVAPPDLRGIAEALIHAKTNVVWQCDVRFDNRLSRALLRKLREAGCRSLIFGLESACQRVLDKMDKGTKVEVMERILSDCKEEGVAVNVGSFIGFPSETDEEARETLGFLLRHKEEVCTVAFGIFFLLPGSRVYSDPGAYGIEILFHDVEYDLPKSVQFGYGEQRLRGKTYTLYQSLQEELYANFYSAPFPFAGTGSSAHDVIFVDRYGPSVYRDRFLPLLVTQQSVPAWKTDDAQLVLNPHLNVIRIHYDLNSITRVLATTIARIKTETLDEGMTWQEAIGELNDLEEAKAGQGHYLIGNANGYRIVCVDFLTMQLLMRTTQGVSVKSLNHDPLALVVRSAFSGSFEKLVEFLLNTGLCVAEERSQKMDGSMRAPE